MSPSWTTEPGFELSGFEVDGIPYRLRDTSHVLRRMFDVLDDHDECDCETSDYVFWSGAHIAPTRYWPTRPEDAAAEYWPNSPAWDPSLRF